MPLVESTMPLSWKIAKNRIAASFDSVENVGNKMNMLSLDNNFYFFIISSDGYYGVGKVENGSQELISNENLMKGKPIKLGKTTNSIRAECVGNNLVLYANDKELASFTDGTFSSGDVGLIAGTFGIAGTDIHFDNFIVKRP